MCGHGSIDEYCEFYPSENFEKKKNYKNVVCLYTLQRCPLMKMSSNKYDFSFGWLYVLIRRIDYIGYYYYIWALSTCTPRLVTWLISTIILWFEYEHQTPMYPCGVHYIFTAIYSLVDLVDMSIVCDRIYGGFSNHSHRSTWIIVTTGTIVSTRGFE